MTKVYKVVLYVVDHEGHDVKNELEYAADLQDLHIKVADVKSSQEFEWNDDLEINKTAATNEDFDVYIKEDTVAISKERYESLLESEDFLSCLEAAGVDNWQGYSDARQMQAEGEDE